MEFDRDCLERFAGVRALYGQEGFEKLQRSAVLVAGNGGVGSWLAEALCRTAVGTLVLIDPDTIELNNSNRQLHTLSSTMGQNKAKTLGARLMDINPGLNLKIIDAYLTPENIDSTLDGTPEYVAEAIDDAIAKAALLNYLYRHKKIFISAGGAGGRTDPSHLQIGDLSQSKGNALLSKVRHDLRTRYGFAKNGIKMGIKCVFSNENPVYSREHATDETLPKFGASMAVTASCGLMMAAYLIKEIVNR